MASRSPISPSWYNWYKEKGVTVWADFTSPTAEDLATIVEELGLHQLAVEDAIHRSKRSKLDRYETHLFLVAYEVGLNLDSGQLTTSEIRAFITPHALVTVHEPDFDMSRIVEFPGHLRPCAPRNRVD